ncbi:MAG: ABC-type phosphate/phosphonate transport system, periplasmic component [Proteobacteria bacterium]|nr:ABC-type phosphate/phosphonate transport system, periplasmic component [Pseudomonadota bacterium]
MIFKQGLEWSLRFKERKSNGAGVRWRWFTAFLVFLSLIAGQVRAGDLAPLKLGIMPFNSTLALLKTHQPLKRHLEAELGRPVVIYTSADYFTFVNELLDGHFDLAIAGPHFGTMASERGSVVLFRYKADLQPVFVVRDSSGIVNLDDLRGKRIGLSSPLSISSIGGVKWLQDSGLRLGQDYHLVERTTHGAAVAAVSVGELDAALTTHTPLKQIPEDVRAKIRVLPLDIHIPHLMTVANTQLGPKLTERIRLALRNFETTPEGREFFRETGYLGYVVVTPADIKSLKPFVDLTVQMMRQGQ